LFISIDFERKGAEECGVELLKNKEHSTRIGLHFGDQELYVDRRKSGKLEIHKAFPSRDTCALPRSEGIHRLEILVDDCVLEVFYNRGQRAMTQLVFSPEDADSLRIFATKGEVLIHQANIQQLSKIWSS
jgi:fructan beta-fructosidase